jgi:hypothetical protein
LDAAFGLGGSPSESLRGLVIVPRAASFYRIRDEERMHLSGFLNRQQGFPFTGFTYDILQRTLNTGWV